jgi:hypothetical protein
VSSYLDTSFLVSLYILDANSAAAARTISTAVRPFPITPFQELELLNAVELRRFRREIRRVEADAAKSAIAADLAAGLYMPAPLSGAAFAAARRLVLQHSAELGTRTLDILHVASALALKSSLFFTFDRRQQPLAAAAGLSAPVLK